MRISAKADHAVRASIELAATESLTPVKGERVADAHALRANIREVLESVTLADVVGGDRPADVVELTKRPDVWQPH